MRAFTSAIVIAILIAILAACDRSRDQVPVAVAPPSPIVVPDCGPTQTHDKAAFARAVDTLRRVGEVKRADNFYRQLRREMEAELALNNSGATLQRIGQPLDAHFSDAQIERSVTCVFADLDKRSASIAAWQQWSQDPVQQALYAMIRDNEGMQHTATPVVGPRRDLLMRLAVALQLTQLHAYKATAMRDVNAQIASAIDPTAPPAANSQTVTIAASDHAAVVDGWLGPALQTQPDTALNALLAFAESPDGRLYFDKITASYRPDNNAWYTQLFALIKQHTVVPERVANPEAAKPLIAEAKRLMHEVGTRQAIEAARPMLLQAENFDPYNPEAKTLLGQAALVLRNGPRPTQRGELRVRTQPQDFAEAEAYLAKGIELGSDNAEAHLSMGRAKYFQGQDAEAYKHYQIAKRIDPEHPYLGWYEGDYAYVRGDFDTAIREYKRVIFQTETRANVHFFALQNMMYALERVNRSSEFKHVGKRYLQLNPKASDFRLEFAEYLLNANERSSEVLEVLMLAAPDQQAERRQALMQRATELRAAEARRRAGR